MQAFVARYDRLVLVLAAGTLAAVAGCSKGDSNVVRVSGTVTYKGQPLKSYLVNFSPEKGRGSTAITDENGHYKLLYTDDQEGVTRGKHQVTVDYAPPKNDPKAAEKAARGQLPQEARAIRAKYADRSRSPLKFDITKSEVIDLKLD